MRDSLYEIYFKLVKVDKNKIFSILHSLSINKIFNNLIKICWENNIQYDVVFKNNELLILYLSEKENSVLLIFSKEKMIFEETFECFLTQILKYNAKRTIFITMGMFEDKILKRPTLIVNRNIRLIDRYTFIKHQLGFTGNVYSDLKESNLKFYRYLPIC